MQRFRSLISHQRSWKANQSASGKECTPCIPSKDQSCTCQETAMSASGLCSLAVPAVLASVCTFQEPCRSPFNSSRSINPLFHLDVKRHRYHVRRLMVDSTDCSRARCTGHFTVCFLPPRIPRWQTAAEAYQRHWQLLGKINSSARQTM